MKVLLAGLADLAWIFYALCALGAIIYAARALAVQRRLAVSLTTFERETMTVQIGRLWRVALLLSLIHI